ncbi:MAG: DUF72 domain-containing protein [Planctomycetota bacterium]
MTAHRDLSPSWPIRLGCPVWASDRWAGKVYPPKTKPTDFLRWYSGTFNTVEGNSTFYTIPDEDVVRRWADESADGFKFALKVPRLISHEHQLTNCESVLETFCRRLEILRDRDRLGPTFLQLGPSFSPSQFDDLERFLLRLPREFAWAVELRHHDWFDQATEENAVNDLLRDREIDKVLFDSRALNQAPPDDAIEAKSQQRKPKTPVRQTVTGNRPMLRIVGRNRMELTDRFFDQWAPIVSRWAQKRMDPYIFVHAPDVGLAPCLARRFAERMRDQLVNDNWEGPTVRVRQLPKPNRQLSLLIDEDSETRG